jgi:16S rRNA (uracil1498-N3)-methyltransferase
MHRFYTLPENIFKDRILLDHDEVKHLKNVLRLSTGDIVRVFDGEGNEFECRIKKVTNTAELKILKKIKPLAEESPLDLWLAVGILKGEKFDFVIQKAVELGVSCFIPVITKRCEIKLNEPERKLERWQKIVIQASKQCGRAKLMKLKSPTHFEKFIQQQSHSETHILFAEKGGVNINEIKVVGKRITAIIGVEGGWDDEELQKASEKGIQIVTFSNGRILRAETAAIVAAAILQNHFGDLY